MNEETKERVGEVATLILKILVVGAAVVTIATLPGLVRLLPRPKRARRLYPWEIRRARLRLQKQQMIKLLKENREAVIRLTPRGRECFELIEEEKRRRAAFDAITMPGYKPWDGLWRVVTFDIPDRRKVVREALRAKLKLLGFFPLQKSVFVHPAPCEKEIAYIAGFFSAEPHIHLIRAKHIDPEHQIREHFGL